MLKHGAVRKALSIMMLFLFTAIPGANAGELFPVACGTYSGTQNALNFVYPYKGDIYFGGNTGCLYGDYSHCAMALENTTQDYYYYSYDDGTYQQDAMDYGYTGQTVECTPTSATNDCINRDCHRFWFYDRAAISYVNAATTAQCTSAANKADNYSGSYDLNASYTGNTTWQCSKLVSRAYNDTCSIVLGSKSSTIRPDNIFYDNDTTTVTTSGLASAQPNLPDHAKLRLQMYKDKGIDVSDITFEYDINKKGIGNYFKRELKNGTRKQQILEDYEITEEQLNTIIADSSSDIL